jgi:hypothetical protein
MEKTGDEEAGKKEQKRKKESCKRKEKEICWREK